jgi:DNA-binding transcriptional MerR regulator
MIRIGEFARLGGVSMAMLRHYDELGLLKPNAVDEPSGYRLYSVRQLPLLHQITGLRDLDCSLAQIAAYLRTDSSQAHLQNLLHQKSAELEARIGEETARLARVRQRITHLKKGVTMYTVQLKSVPAQLVASVRNPQLEAKTPEGWRSIAAYYDTLNAHLEQHLEHAIPGSAAVRVYELPALPAAASLIFEGRYDGEPMTDAFTALYRWTEDNGYRIAGPTRQAFLKSLPEPETFQIELQVPLEKA